MKRWRVALGAALASAACSHTHAVEQGAKGTGGSGEAHATRAEPGAPLTAPGPEGILRPDAVRDIQVALAAKGLPTGHGGTLDAETRKGLAAFQKKANLAETGLPDRETLRRLGLNPAVILRQ